MFSICSYSVTFRRDNFTVIFKKRLLLFKHYGISEQELKINRHFTKKENFSHQKNDIKSFF